MHLCLGKVRVAAVDLDELPLLLRTCVVHIGELIALDGAVAAYLGKAHGQTERFQAAAIVENIGTQNLHALGYGHLGEARAVGKGEIADAVELARQLDALEVLAGVNREPFECRHTCREREGGELIAGRKCVAADDLDPVGNGEGRACLALGIADERGHALAVKHAVFYAVACVLVADGDALKCVCKTEHVSVKAAHFAAEAHGGRRRQAVKHCAAYLGHTVCHDDAFDLLAVLFPRCGVVAVVVGHLAGAGDGECAVLERPCHALAAAAADGGVIGEGRCRKKRHEHAQNECDAE